MSISRWGKVVSVPNIPPRPRISTTRKSPFRAASTYASINMIWFVQWCYSSLPIKVASCIRCVKRLETETVVRMQSGMFGKGSQVNTMGLLQDRQNCGLHMHRECRERFPRHRLQRKPLVSDPDKQHGTCVTHVPWCMSGSLTRGGGEHVPGIRSACVTVNSTYLWRGPFWCRPDFCICLGALFKLWKVAIYQTRSVIRYVDAKKHKHVFTTSANRW